MNMTSHSRILRHRGIVKENHTKVCVIKVSESAREGPKTGRLLAALVGSNVASVGWYRQLISKVIEMRHVNERGVLQSPSAHGR